MKVHLRDNKIKAEDFIGSSHVVRSIHNGVMAVCGISTYEQLDKITDDESEVECLSCLGLEGVSTKGYIIITKEDNNG